MATYEQIIQEIKWATEEFNRLSLEYYNNDHFISANEFLELEKFHDIVVNLNTILAIDMAVKAKDVSKLKKYVDDSYANAKKQETLVLDAFKKLEASPSQTLIDEYHIQYIKFKFEINNVTEINKVLITNRVFLNSDLYVNDLLRREKELEPIKNKLEEFKKQFKLQAIADKQTGLDSKSIDEVSDIKGMHTKFNGLLSRMHTTQDNIIVHFIGWQQTCYGICMAHVKAEEKFKDLMKAQTDETAKEAKLRSIALGIASSIGNIIFPGLSTPITTVLTGVLSPVLDKKITEYKDATLNINKSVKAVKIGQTVEQELAKKYVGNLATIAANFDGISDALKGDSKKTFTSNFEPSNAAESLLKYNTQICAMIHEAAEKVLTLENICQDIVTRVENASTSPIFEDKNIDTSGIMAMLKELYKILSKAVNTLHSAKDSLKPPKISSSLYAKPGDNEIFNKFVNIMLLKWLPSIEVTKERIRSKSMIVQPSGIRTVWYKEIYQDYPSLIAKEVQVAITKYCGISADSFKDIPYDTATDWTTWDSTSDAAIAKLIKAAEGKIKGMESTNVWTSVLGL